MKSDEFTDEKIKLSFNTASHLSTSLHGRKSEITLQLVFPLLLLLEMKMMKN